MTLGEGIRPPIDMEQEMRSMARKTREQDQREKRQIAIRNLLTRTGTFLMQEGRIDGVDIYSDQDCHAFYRPASQTDTVLHIQAYPGFSDSKVTYVKVREMDYSKFLAIRARAKQAGGPSVGNEHAAVTRDITGSLTSIPNTRQGIIDLLDAELPVYSQY